MPRGMRYRQTALIRLRERLGEPDITPAHRLGPHDRRRLVFGVWDSPAAARIRCCSVNRQAVKIYECLAPAGRSAARDSHDWRRSNCHARSYCCADRTSPRNIYTDGRIRRSSLANAERLNAIDLCSAGGEQRGAIPVGKSSAASARAPANSARHVIRSACRRERRLHPRIQAALLTFQPAAQCWRLTIHRSAGGCEFVSPNLFCIGSHS